MDRRSSTRPVLAVELFTIHCTTCRTRLKVNDESVIGDILACPKCGSMVQVVPPVGWSRSPTGDQAAPQFVLPPPGTMPPAPSPVPPIARKPAAPPPRPSLPARSASPPPPALTTTAKFAVSNPPVSNPPVSNPAVAKAAAAAPSPAAALSATSTGQWVPPTLAAAASIAPVARHSPAQHSFAAAFSAIAAHARREWKLLSGALASGIALGGAIWLVVAMQATTVEPLADADRASSALSDASQSRPSDTPPTAPAAALPDQSADEVSAVAADDRASEVEEPTAAAAELDELAVEQAGAAVAEEAPQVALPTPASGTASPANPVPPRATIKLEPVTPGKTAATGAVNSEVGAATANTLSTAPQALAPSDPGATSDPAASPDPVAADVGESQGSPVTLLTADQIEGRLAQPLAKIEFSKTPLPKFLDFIGDLAGVRVRMDEAALAHMKSGAAKPVSLQMADTTAGDALRAAAAKLGLAYVIRDGQIVVTRARERGPGK
jgi:hypothetical protein